MRKENVNPLDYGIELDYSSGRLKYCRLEDCAVREYGCVRERHEVSVNSWPETWGNYFDIPAGALVCRSSWGWQTWDEYPDGGRANLECDGDSLEYIVFTDEAPYVRWMYYIAKE